MTVDTLSRSSLIYFLAKASLFLQGTTHFFPLLDLWRMNVLVIEGHTGPLCVLTVLICKDMRCVVQL